MRWPWAKAEITTVGHGFTEAWVPVGTVLQLNDGKKYVVTKVVSPSVLTVRRHLPWLSTAVAFMVGLGGGYLMGRFG
jgi:hypothetical protein